jgi:hypothetical protein
MSEMYRNFQMKTEASDDSKYHRNNRKYIGKVIPDTVYMSPGFDQIPPGMSKPTLKYGVAWVKGDAVKVPKKTENVSPPPQRDHLSNPNSDADCKSDPAKSKNLPTKSDVYKMMLGRLKASKNSVDVKVTLDRDTFEDSLKEMSLIAGYQNMQLLLDDIDQELLLMQFKQRNHPESTSKILVGKSGNLADSDRVIEVAPGVSDDDRSLADRLDLDSSIRAKFDTLQQTKVDSGGKGRFGSLNRKDKLKTIIMGGNVTSSTPIGGKSLGSGRNKANSVRASGDRKRDLDMSLRAGGHAGQKWGIFENLKNQKKFKLIG